MIIAILLRKLKRVQLLCHGRKLRFLGPCSVSPTARFDFGYGGAISIGSQSSIGHGVIMDPHGGVITVGESVFINAYCVLCGHGGLEIGSHTQIACHTVIIPANHNYKNSRIRIDLQGERKEGIRIEDDVWIGANCVVLDGVTIASGSVIAAGAVVTRSTEAFGIYAGVPARRIGARTEFASVSDV